MSFAVKGWNVRTSRGHAEEYVVLSQDDAQESLLEPAGQRR